MDTINEIKFVFNNENNIIGDSFDYCLYQFALMSAKKEGDYYTPEEISELLSKLATLDKNNLKSIYDPTCGVGSLLLRVAKEVDEIDIYGQELDETRYNLARMNMILHGISCDRFDIKKGDSLENPKHIDIKFDSVVAHLPFAVKWSRDKHFLEDVRFSESGILPYKTKAVYAFIQHMLYHLKQRGTIVLFTFQGILLNKTGSETSIIKYLIEEKNYLDAVIGLPANLFYKRSYHSCILIFKRCREHNNILFINASEGYEKLTYQNRLQSEDINKILQTYVKRAEINNYSRIVSLKEIQANGYSLFPTKYIKPNIKLQRIFN